MADTRKIIEIKFDLHHVATASKKRTKIWTIDFFLFFNFKY